jgi:hypothetical protein
VVNLANDGYLSTTGKFISTPSQIERIFEHMERWHNAWSAEAGRDEQGGRAGDAARHIVIYAHGGLTDEAEGLATAQKHLNWWLNNRVYPVYFAWQSGPIETLLNQLTDTVKGRLPFGLGFDLAEQVDRFVEKVAGVSFTWMWDQMKQNARAASRPLDEAGSIEWPPVSSAARNHMARQPGASLAIDRLARYIQMHGAASVKVHLVGHSAGSIFLAALVNRLQAAGINAETMTYLAPAIRVDEFEREVLPHLGSTIKRFATFAMSDQRELDDVCGANGVIVYRKSLLYLVSRALERPGRGDAGEVPLVGMERFFDRPLQSAPDRSLRAAIQMAGGAAIFSRSAVPDDSRSDAKSHGWIDDDAPTMTSVVMRIRGTSRAQDVDDYVANAALSPVSGLGTEIVGGAPAAQRAARAATRAPATTPTVTLPPKAPDRPVRMGALDRPPELLQTPAAVNEPGEIPLTETKEAQAERPVAPRSDAGPVVEVADAPETGSSVLDILVDAGWRSATETRDTTHPSAPASAARDQGDPRKGQ